MKITDVKGIPADALKKKSLPLYKAFIFPKDDMEMQVNVNIDLLGLTPEAAVQRLLQDIPVEVFTEEMDEKIENLFELDPSSDKDDGIKGFDVIRSFGESMQITHSNDGVHKVNMKNTVVAFAVFKMDVEDLKSKSLVDGDEDYFKDDIIAITLSDKKYKLDVDEKKLLSFKLVINPVNEERIISGIELKDIK